MDEYEDDWETSGKFMRLEMRLYENGHKRLSKFLNRFAWWGWRKWAWAIRNLSQNQHCPQCGKRMRVYLDWGLYMCEKCIEMYTISGSSADMSIPNLRLDDKTRY